MRRNGRRAARAAVAVLAVAIPIACASGNGTDEDGAGAPDTVADGATDRAGPGEDAGVGEAREDGAVRLSASPATGAAAGDVQTLTLANGSEGAVGYNLCTSALERSAGEGWDPVPSDRMCTMELRTLPPGGEATFEIGLPEDLGAGTYRWSTKVERLESGGRDVVATEPFEVAS